MCLALWNKRCGHVISFSPKKKCEEQYLWPRIDHADKDSAQRVVGQ